MGKQKHLHHRTSREYMHDCARPGPDFGCRFGSTLVFVIIRRERNKKAGVVEHLEVLDHAGLPVNEPPGKARLPFT